MSNLNQRDQPPKESSIEIEEIRAALIEGEQSELMDISLEEIWKLGSLMDGDELG